MFSPFTSVTDLPITGNQWNVAWDVNQLGHSTGCHAAMGSSYWEQLDHCWFHQMFNAVSSKPVNCVFGSTLAILELRA